MKNTKKNGRKKRRKCTTKELINSLSSQILNIDTILSFCGIQNLVNGLSEFGEWKF